MSRIYLTLTLFLAVQLSALPFVGAVGGVDDDCDGTIEEVVSNGCSATVWTKTSTEADGITTCGVHRSNVDTDGDRRADRSVIEGGCTQDNRALGAAKCGIVISVNEPGLDMAPGGSGSCGADTGAADVSCGIEKIEIAVEKVEREGIGCDSGLDADLLDGVATACAVAISVTEPALQRTSCGGSVYPLPGAPGVRYAFTPGGEPRLVLLVDSGRTIGAGTVVEIIL